MRFAGRIVVSGVITGLTSPMLGACGNSPDGTNSPAGSGGGPSSTSAAGIGGGASSDSSTAATASISSGVSVGASGSGGATGSSGAGAGGASTGGAGAGGGQGGGAPGVCSGFGATTLGGDGQPEVHVTSLADAGAGTLRAAVSQGNRKVVFDIGGEIVLTDYLYVQGAFVTIDATTAPPPGITLRNRGLIVRGNQGAHDVIVRGIRVRDSALDGFQVAYGAYNVVLDHVSVHGSGDGNIDITESSHDVTVCWSILAEPAGTEKNMLIKYNPSRVTLHNNLFIGANQRNPQVRIDDAGTPATDTTLDMRNNIVWDWGTGYGTLVWYGARANVVGNYYSSPASSSGDKAHALDVCTGNCDGGVAASLAYAYVEGNFSADNLATDINTLGNANMPFPAPSVPTIDACVAAAQVLASAGSQPLDAIDQSYVSSVALAPCP